MSLRDVLQRVMIEYRDARTAAFAGHPLASFIRNECRQEVTNFLGDLGAGLIIEGSSGAGNWALVPWIALFDPSVTNTASRGYYVCYLFHAGAPIVHLSVNQGTTQTREEFGSRTRQILADRGEFMRRRLSDFATLLPASAIDLGSTARLPGDYVAGHALGVTYHLERLPSDAELQTDLQTAVRAYRALIFRGGLEAEIGDNPEDEFLAAESASLIEIRRYRAHRRIERTASASRLAKKHHGTRCQACLFEFAEKYGSIGEGFIEVHHLVPISTLEEGVPVRYEVADDFAVLCPNCHRMLHRTSDPSDLDSFRDLLGRISAGRQTEHPKVSRPRVCCVR
jgi:5-methylcytosine-specific restriction protein A